jgi:hypothetical protein
MARQPRFKLNYRNVGRFLKNDEGGKQKLREVAQKVLAQTGDDEARLEEYTTDRAVVGVIVPADKQAKYGTGTRAAAQAGLKRGRAG